MNAAGGDIKGGDQGLGAVPFVFVFPPFDRARPDRPGRGDPFQSFTPKHASWLNQIEMWFSILARKLIRRGDFKSQADLAEQIRRFIEYFNQTMAKPFRWIMTGKPLTV